MDRCMSFETILKKKGIRITKQRLAILNILADVAMPLSAQNIFARLKDKYPKLELSTVYRNLNFFVEKNILKRIYFNNKLCLFELIGRHHHHHLFCIKCGKITPIDCPLQDFAKRLEEETDYQIVDHKFNIYGICPKCKKK